MRVEVVSAWPGRHESRLLDLPDTATLADALEASGLDVAGVAAYAVFGELATPADALRDGDRVELLRRLHIDPKEARRRRALKPAR